MKKNQPNVYGVDIDTPATPPNPWIKRIAYLSIFIFVISASYVLFSGRDHYSGGQLVGAGTNSSGCVITTYINGTSYFEMLLEGRAEEVYIDFYDLYPPLSDKSLDDPDSDSVIFDEGK